MTTVDTFGAYVRHRLDEWGRCFALHRDCEYLGHRSKDMLQVLIEHRGEMPPRPTGYKPLEIPPLEQQIEDIVAGIARVNLTRATVLRGYYCGTGRRGVERLEITNEMLMRLDCSPLSRTRYFAEHAAGFDDVCDTLMGTAMRAA